jgi:radical SAM superfamily enzyme
VKVGFDLDGTLDHPELAALCNLLYDAGAEIHVITAGAIGETGYQATEEKKQLKLQILGIKYHHLHIVTGATFEEAGQEKAAKCEYYGIEVMIDDSSSFVHEMVKGTTAIILHVRMAGEPGGKAAR